MKMEGVENDESLGRMKRDEWRGGGVRERAGMNKCIN